MRAVTHSSDRSGSALYRLWRTEQGPRIQRGYERFSGDNGWRGAIILRLDRLRGLGERGRRDSKPQQDLPTRPAWRPAHRRRDLPARHLYRFDGGGRRYARILKWSAARGGESRSPANPDLAVR